MAILPAPQASGGRRTALRKVLLTIGLALLGIVPFLRVADPNLWLDEVLTYRVATAPWGEHLELVYRTYDHPPLFFHLIWLLGRFTESPAVLGMMPAFCVVGAGGVLAWSLWRSEPVALRRQTVGLFAAMFALCPELSYQAWNLRHYGFWLLMGSFYLAAWGEALRGNARAHRISPLFAGLALLTHHFTVFPVAVAELAGGWILWRSNSNLYRQTFLSRLLLFIPFAIAWCAVAWAQYPGSGGELVGRLLSYQGLPALKEVWGRFHGAPAVLDLPWWQSAAALGVGVLLLGFDIARLRRAEPAERFWFAVAYLPLAAVFALSLFTPALASRFLAISAAALMALHARSLVRAGRWGYTAAGVAMAVMAMGLGFQLTRPAEYPPYSEYIPRILETVKKGEVLVLPPGSMPDVYLYHARRASVAMPASISIPVPVLGRDRFEAAMDALPGQLAPYRRAWVVYELPRFWDPENRTQTFFEKSWTIGPYQSLWEKRWVLTYYDNPRLNRPGT